MIASTVINNAKNALKYLEETQIRIICRWTKQFWEVESMCSCPLLPSIITTKIMF